MKTPVFVPLKNHVLAMEKPSIIYNKVQNFPTKTSKWKIFSLTISEM